MCQYGIVSGKLVAHDEIVHENRMNVNIGFFIVLRHDAQRSCYKPCAFKPTAISQLLNRGGSKTYPSIP